jgi:type I restriction enzyme S subunit
MHFQLKKQHRRYAKYKDTGIVWLREVPEGWEVKKLKNAFIFTKGKNSQLYTKEFIGDEKNKGDYPVYSGQTDCGGVMGMVSKYEYDLKESIFVTTVGAKVMTPMIISGKFSLSQNCALFFEKPGIFMRFFFLFLISTIQKNEG